MELAFVKRGGKFDELTVRQKDAARANPDRHPRDARLSFPLRPGFVIVVRLEARDILCLR